MREWLWRLAAMWRRDRESDARRDELQFHFDAEVEAASARGMSVEEARREARRRVGSVSAGEVDAHEGIGIRALDALSRDVSQAARSLTRHAAFTTLAGAVLVLSVAVAVLLFALFDGVLLRPLPYRQPDRLVRIYDGSPAQPRFPMAIGRYLEYRHAASSLDGLALYTGRDVELSGDGRRSARLTGVAITGEYFSVLGWAPASGRAFTDGDLRPDTRNVILSDRVWRAEFSADSAIVGRVIRLNRQSWTVIGVMPPGFQHIGGDYRSPPQGDTVDVWLPLSIDTTQPGNLNGSHYCNAVARIRAGRSFTAARQELAALAAGYSQRYAQFGTWTANVSPLFGEVTGRSRSLVTLLAVAAALVLTVACANIAGLCVARALTRQKDEEVRRALGASRWQRLRVALSENLLVGLAGAAAGVLVAASALPTMRAWLPVDFPRLHEVAFTARSAVFGVAVALTTVLLATVLAAGSTRTVVAGTRTTAGRRTRRLRTLLVVVEIALAGVLCAGTIQLWRHYRALTAQDHGFATSGVLTFRVSIPIPSRPEPGAIGARLESLRKAVLEVEDVRHAGITTNLPWSGYDENSDLRVVGRDMGDDPSTSVRYQAASDGYFDAMRMRVLSGRTFDATRDIRNRPRVIVINDATARRLFPAGNAVGTRVEIFGEQREIIGVVRGIGDQPTSVGVEPAMWFPLGQVDFVDVFFAVLVDGARPLSRLDAIRAALERIDPALPISDVQMMEARAATALANQRLALRLFQAFAMLTLLLAASGLYGLLAYVVHQRRKELSIRAAVGATRTDLAGLVLRDSLSMAIAGALACAAVLPAASGGWMAWTSGLGRLDAWAWIGTPALLLAIALLASLGPAHQASRQTDVGALRED
jgi:predicted permease